MSKGSNANILIKIEESANQPIFLYQIKVDDSIYHRFAGNQTADITFDGHTWQAAAISHDPIDTAQDSRVDETTVKLAGISSELVSYLTSSDNTINGYEVIIKKVFRDSLTDPNNYILEFTGEIDGYSFDGNWISVHVRRSLGTFSKIIPGETFGALCPLTFKGPECGYTGATITCDRTATACAAMAGGSNMNNYGGFPWVPVLKQK